MTAVKTANTYPKTAESFTKKISALWRWLNRTEESPDGGFDDTYCMCRFLQTPFNRALDSAIEQIASPQSVDAAVKADAAASTELHRRKQIPLRIATAKPAFEFDI